MDADTLKNTEAEIENYGGAEQAPVSLKSGERGFSLVLCLVGLFFLIQSIAMWNQVSEPKLSSAAALPLFCSAAWTILALWDFLGSLRMKSPLSGLKSFKETAKGLLGYVFPKTVVVMIAAILVYCVALMFHISFYIATPIFLWGSMSYLMRDNYVKNILWTAILIAFIIVVFQILFGVVMP